MSFINVQQQAATNMVRVGNDNVISDQNGRVESPKRKPEVLWNKRIPDTEMDKFKYIIEAKYEIKLNTFWDLHKWSIECSKDFWKEVWRFFSIVASQPYDEVFVKTGPGFLDCEWFKGVRFNLAENILRCKDNTVGLICVDETQRRESFTFSEIFQQVQLYASAFRKLGLRKGDGVGCFISNRKEALFAMLAVMSVGATWGGPAPYYGPKPVSRILEAMNPKFLLTTDYYMEDGIEDCKLDILPTVVKGLTSLQKVIVVATKEDTTSSKLSLIPKSILLEEFLEWGRKSDGTVPELLFEQLPFDHPTSLNFTSGTTGPPKGVVHAAGSLICQLRDFSLHLNLKKGDVLYLPCPVGWAVWDYHVPCLSLGVTLLMFDGSPAYRSKGSTIWEVFAQNQVTCAFLPAMYVDCFEKLNITPGADTDLTCLRIITFGASVLRPQNYHFLHSKIKSDLIVLNWYGASEVFGVFCGFDFNIPLHVGELQGPALGVDLHCFDESGVWTQNDECWINPETRGIFVIGRSDDTLKQRGERFGAADIYYLIDEIEELDDYICVGQHRHHDGETRAVLFVKLKSGHFCTPLLKEKISETIKRETSEEYVPEAIIEVPDIPYNFNKKRMESLVRKIVSTNQIPEVSNIRNPESLQHYQDIPEILSYSKNYLV